MKKLSLLIGSFLCSQLSFSQNFQMLGSSENTITIQHSLQDAPQYYTQINNQNYVDFAQSHKITTKKTGAPQLPMFSESVVVPNKGDVSISIEHDGYTDYHNINVAPSKGSLKRNVDPSSVPYTFGQVYNQNSFFPVNIAQLSEPFVLRKTRGVTVTFYPYQYNPITKTLRVYQNVRAVVHTNPLVKGESELPVDLSVGNDEYKQIYENLYLNESNLQAKYTPKPETGEMLVICPASFTSQIQPLVDWKNQKGIKCTLVTTATTGSTAANIKTYVQNYYASNPNLIFLLLVGDHGDLPTHSYGTSGGGEALYSDTYYAQLSGGTNDYYPELFVGRLSGTTSNVTTMVTRILEYEKTPASGDWMNKAIGIGSAEGAGQGDDGEADWQHMRNIRTKLTGYGYGTVYEYYDGSQGGSDASGNPTATTVQTSVSSGVGLINYTGHGDQNTMVTSNFTTTNVNNATNTNKYPWVISVACNNGTFATGTCISEAWVRAASGTTPKGAIAACGSSILMAWAEPMQTQDEIAEILSESYANNRKQTIGGLFYNGQMSMLETYGASANAKEVMQTWVMFGDPSTLFRTKVTQNLTVTHVSSVATGTTTVAVNCNTEGALICISKDNVIQGTGYVTGGVANITIPAVSGTTSLLVTGTKQNYAAYQGNIAIGGSTPGTVAIASNDADNTICAGTSVTFTATPTNATSPSYQWQVNGSNVGTNSPTYTTSSLTNGQVVTCIMTSSGSPSTSNSVTVTVTPSVTPAVSIASSATSICAGTATTFTATGTNGGASPSYQWQVNGSNVGTNAVTYSSSSLTNGQTVTCILTSNATCASSTTANSNTISMTVNSAPTGTTTSNSPICSGTNLQLTANYSGATYAWTGPNGFTSTSATPSVSAAGTNASGTYTVTATSNGCSTTGTVSVTVNPSSSPAVSISSANNTICSGNTATFTATGTNGGTSPIYQWYVNGSPVGSNAATYSSSSLTNGQAVTCVLTTNSTCASSTTANSNTITMTVNSAPTGTTNSNSPVCSGSALQLTANYSGATFSWSGPNGFSSTSANPSIGAATTNASGTYTVVATSNGCSTTSTVDVTVSPSANPAISISSSSSSICAGATATFTANAANGGATPTFQWYVNGSPVGTNWPSFTSSTLTNGQTVTCMLTSSATTCITTPTASSNTITMTVGTAPTGTSTSNSPVCEGSAIQLNANYTSGTTYAWSGPNGFTSTAASPSVGTATTGAAGIYTLTATLNGCATTSTVTVAVNPTPATPTISQNGNILTSSATSGNQWYLDNNAMVGAVGQTLTAMSNGSYTVVVTNSSGCSSTASVAVNYNSAGMEENEVNGTELVIYPNPSNGFFYLEFHSNEATNYEVLIHNAAGQVVFKTSIENTVNDYKLPVDISNYGKGEYYITITNAKNERVEKVVTL